MYLLRINCKLIILDWCRDINTSGSTYFSSLEFEISWYNNNCWDSDIKCLYGTESNTTNAVLLLNNTAMWPGFEITWRTSQFLGSSV